MFQQDIVRADAYGLISQLFSGPPDAALLRLHSPPPANPELKFTLQEPEPKGYDGALKRFQTACGQHAAEDIAVQYRRLFTSLHNTLAAPAAPNALAALREHLRACGLTPREGAVDVDFYVPGVCDVLRWLIEHDRPQAVQLSFFTEFVDEGITALCDAIDATPGASFYYAVADLTRHFIVAERMHLGADS